MADPAPRAAADKPRTEEAAAAVGPNVLCLLPILEWTLGDIRIKNPLTRWSERYGGALRRRLLNDFSTEDISWADVVLFQRDSNEVVLGLIRDLRKLGKVCLFDIDDLLTEVPPFLSVHDYTQRIRPYLQDSLRSVDAVIVTTPRLQAEMTQYNSRVFVVPNCAPDSFPPARHDARPDHPISLVIASSDTVRVDFVVPALKRLLADPALDLRLIGIGPPGAFLAEVGLPVERFDNMNYLGFRRFLASLDNAIGLIPLDDSRFSGCKSVIKFVDYSLSGIPSVCSAVAPYADTAEHDQTALLVEADERSWYHAVKRLALSADERCRLAANARSLCLSRFSMDQAAGAWQAVFHALDVHHAETKVRADVLRHHRWRSVLRLAKRMTTPADYRAAYRLWRAEGLAGLRQRFGRQL